MHHVRITTTEFGIYFASCDLLLSIFSRRIAKQDGNTVISVRYDAAFIRSRFDRALPSS